jgi:MFS superfamily sulfate permease-like transporter
MAGGILAVSVLRLSDEHGVQIVGAMQAGLPVVSLPEVSLDDVLDLLPGASAIVLFLLSGPWGWDMPLVENMDMISTRTKN